jgi:chromosome segregation ATPase
MNNDFIFNYINDEYEKKDYDDYQYLKNNLKNNYDPKYQMKLFARFYEEIRNNKFLNKDEKKKKLDFIWKLVMKQKAMEINYYHPSSSSSSSSGEQNDLDKLEDLILDLKNIGLNGIDDEFSDDFEQKRKREKDNTDAERIRMQRMENQRKQMQEQTDAERMRMQQLEQQRRQVQKQAEAERNRMQQLEQQRRQVQKQADNERMRMQQLEQQRRRMQEQSEAERIRLQQLEQKRLQLQELEQVERIRVELARKKEAEQKDDNNSGKIYSSEPSSSTMEKKESVESSSSSSTTLICPFHNTETQYRDKIFIEAECKICFGEHSSMSLLACKHSICESCCNDLISKNQSNK